MSFQAVLISFKRSFQRDRAIYCPVCWFSIKKKPNSKTIRLWIMGVLNKYCIFFFISFHFFPSISYKWLRSSPFLVCLQSIFSTRQWSVAVFYSSLMKVQRLPILPLLLIPRNGPHTLSKTSVSLEQLLIEDESPKSSYQPLVPCYSLGLGSYNVH